MVDFMCDGECGCTNPNEVSWCLECTKIFCSTCYNDYHTYKCNDCKYMICKYIKECNICKKRRDDGNIIVGWNDHSPLTELIQLFSNLKRENKKLNDKIKEQEALIIHLKNIPRGIEYQKAKDLIVALIT